MAQDSKIEWCHHSANLWHGCTAVHSGCDHCYAEALSHRWGRDLWGKDKPRMEIKSVWKDLDRYQRLAKEANELHLVLVGSMMDIFEKSMPLVDSKGTLDKNQNTGNLRFHLFYRIDRGDYPNLMFLFLTKRPSNINKYIFESWKDSPPANVMFGTSPVDQKTFDTLVPQLLEVKGKHFLSIEPQLGAINLKLHERWCAKTEDSHDCDLKVDHIQWIIQGGESGHHKRPFDLAWGRSMRDQCKEFGVPYFFKQIDKVQSIPDDLMIREFPEF